jgi:hypothetical protein
MTLTGLYGLELKRRSNDYRKFAPGACASWLIIVLIPQATWLYAIFCAA